MLTITANDKATPSMNLVYPLKNCIASEVCLRDFIQITRAGPVLGMRVATPHMNLNRTFVLLVVASWGVRGARELG